MPVGRGLCRGVPPVPRFRSAVVRFLAGLVRGLCHGFGGVLCGSSLAWCLLPVTPHGDAATLLLNRTGTEIPLPV